MKKIIFLVFILSLLFVEINFAQTITSYGMKIGLSAAGERSLNKYQGVVSDFSNQRRVGITVAGFIEWFDTPVFSLLTQFAYTQKGMNERFIYTSTDQTIIIDIDNRLDYLSFPIFFKLRKQTETVSPYIIIGPRVDYLLGYNSDRNAYNHLYDNFKKAVLGGSVGIGIQIESLMPVRFVMEASYNGDFTNSYNTERSEISYNTFDFLIGIGF